MEIIAIGDTHGRSTWKLIKELETNFDKFIFIGDYFDSRDGFSAAEQIHNFKEIIEFKKANLNKVILLTGNHDAIYHPSFIAAGQHSSGFQNMYATDIQHILQENKEYLQMCFIHDKFIFTHAGISGTWLQHVCIEQDENLEQSINEMWVHKPLAFTFSGYDPSGDDITQSPIWIRPHSLEKDRIYGIHVVGHTAMKTLNVKWNKNLILIDTLGTTGEYLKIIDGIPSVGQTH